MSWGDCDFAGSGDAEEPAHGGCVMMAGHLGPHKDCNGREWYTSDQKDYKPEPL